MNIQQLLQDKFVVTFVGGIILWMISEQMVIRYTQRNLKSLCIYLYGDKNYYTGKLGMYDTFNITMIAIPLFVAHHLPKREKSIEAVVKTYVYNYSGLTKETVLPS